MKNVTPLRYPGGKGKLGPWLGELMRHNKISGGYYVEPYAGGAGAALYLLMSGYVNHIIINDLDPAIHAFWWSILNKSDEFIEKIKQTDVTAVEWKKQKEILNHIDDHDMLSIGFATFFLNRTNRSGILKGGMIGGNDQSGNYKIDARYNKQNLIERIEYVAFYKDRISLYNLDALRLLQDVVSSLPNKALVYLDPPYYVKGGQLYRNHYKHDDHKELSDAVKNIGHSWLVTYDKCDEIKELYYDSECIEFSLRYSTHTSRSIATEYMFHGNLKLHEYPSLVKKD